MTHAEILKKCYDVLDAKMIVDGEYMSAKELEDLKELRYKVWHWHVAEKHKEYLGQLKDFRKHLQDLLPDEDNGDWDTFGNMDFTISFNGKSVTIYNGAESFGTIESLIDSEIEEFEELE